jgi:hypothetical protein
MADFYPDEEGHISDGLVIGFCQAVDAVEVHEAVALGITTVTGAVSILAAAADGDAVGVTLKAGGIGAKVPVCFYGVMKLKAGTAITAGQILQNDSLGTYILDIKDTITGCDDWWITLAGISGTGTVFRLGMALQAAANSGDDFLVLVGGLR